MYWINYYIIRKVLLIKCYKNIYQKDLAMIVRKKLKKTMFLGLFVCFAILLQYGNGFSGFGDPESCYFCNTEVHGQGCNDPIVPDQIQIQTCSNMETVHEGTSSFSKVWNFFTHQDTNKTIVARNISTRNTYPKVCYYMSYVINGKTISSRGCEFQSIDSMWGSTFPICDYYWEYLGPHNTRVTNYTCHFCRDNLCNYPSTSNSVDLVISIKLIVSLLVTKFYLM